MPTERVIRKALTRVRKKLARTSEDPLLQPDGLERASLQGLDELTRPSADLLREALDERFGDGSGRQPSDSWLTLLVLPPCDETGIVGDWARDAGHQLLASPQRHELIADRRAAAPDLDGAGLLVIPRLEQWFVRQRNGLQMLRSLLARLAVLERRCLIGCNSWAWRYLVKAVGADALLPRPLTLDACDALRLKAWFAEHAVDDAGRPLTFRLTNSGQDVLETDESGALQSGHLQQLAARSLGIPWAAAHLWRASLSVKTASDDLPERALRATADDFRTVWVADIDDGNLPPGHEDRSLLALQALLIHDALTEAELDSVLPATGEPDVMPALVAAGFVQREARLSPRLSHANFRASGLVAAKLAGQSASTSCPVKKRTRCFVSASRSASSAASTSSRALSRYACISEAYRALSRQWLPWKRRSPGSGAVTGSPAGLGQPMKARVHNACCCR